MKQQLTTDWVGVALRRAKFLLDEAKSGEGVYDSAVAYSMRVISNVATIGENGSSEAIKWKNRYISRKAFELYQTTPDKEWHKLTTNEHPEPLRQVWDWIMANAQQLEPKDILQRFQANPMVTITKSEDSQTSTNGFRWKGAPLERLQHVEILACGPPVKRRRKRGL